MYTPLTYKLDLGWRAANTVTSNESEGMYGVSSQKIIQAVDEGKYLPH
jgi:hypothetical protein